MPRKAVGKKKELRQITDSQEGGAILRVKASCSGTWPLASALAVQDVLSLVTGHCGSGPRYARRLEPGHRALWQRPSLCKTS